MSGLSDEDERLIEAWRTVGAGVDLRNAAAVDEVLRRRDELVQQMKDNDLFPKEDEARIEAEGALYPDTEDPNFIPKLMSKLQFAENKQLSIQDRIDRLKEKLLAEGKYKESEWETDWDLITSDRFKDDLYTFGLSPCRESLGFELSPTQRFIGQFLSPKSPYMSALLFHGVGVGKTCSAITVAESYLDAYPKKQVLIIAPRNIQPNFNRNFLRSQTSNGR